MKSLPAFNTEILSMMNPQYAIRDTSAVFSPALVFYKDLIRQNIARAVEIAGDPGRLRPHVKTHKTREIARLELDAGITQAQVRHARRGRDAGRLRRARRAAGLQHGRPQLRPHGPADPALPALPLLRHWPTTPPAAKPCPTPWPRRARRVDVLIDLDVGQHRTGIAPGPEAAALYEQIARLPGLRPGGFHVYDGHNHQESFVERQAAALRSLEPVLALRDAAREEGPAGAARSSSGGTPTFPVYARLDLPGLECRPAPASCTTTATARASPTWPASRRPPCC